MRKLFHAYSLQIQNSFFENKKYGFALLFCFLLLPALGQAQDSLYKSSVEDVMKMPITQKEEETVTTASKKAESALAAPAAMSVITSKEIEAFGALNLHQVLDRVSSMYATGFFILPEGIMSMRGTNSTFDVHTLILLNGRPIRENYASFRDIYANFPIQSLEKIEIIRGSGSVLYGSNAYTCIINLITKKAQENLQVDASMRYGSFQTFQPQIGISKKIKGLSLSFYGNYFKTEGWQLTGRGDADMKLENGQEVAINPPQSVLLSRDNYAALLKADFKNFSFQYLRSGAFTQNMSTQVTFWTPYWRFARNSENYWDLGYQKKWNKLALTMNLNYAYFLREGLSPQTPNYVSGNNESITWLSELYLQYTFNQKLHFSMGGTWNNIKATGITTTRDSFGFPFDWLTAPNTMPYHQLDASENWYSAYFQTDYQIFDFLKIDLGGQLNKAGSSPFNFVPRVNVVANWHKRFFGKMMYGKAFRSPNMIEKFNNSNVIHSAAPIALVGGGNALNPETITTSEIQFAYKNTNIQFTVGYFNSFQENLISTSSPADSLVIANAGEVGKKLALPKQINRGTLHSQGIEIEAKASLKNIYLTSSLSLFDIQEGKSTGMPQMMLKLGVVYDIPKIGFQMSIFNSYFGKNEIIKTRFLTANPKVTPYNFMTLNLNWNLKKMYEGSKNKPDIILNFYINNLFNEQIFYPEYTRRVINSVQGRAGRAFYVSLNYTFGK